MSEPKPHRNPPLTAMNAAARRDAAATQNGPQDRGSARAVAKSRQNAPLGKRGLKPVVPRRAGPFDE